MNLSTGWINGLFVRHIGAGRPVVLLHASPMSGASLQPLMTALAPFAQVLAWDTPGYGASRQLTPAARSLADYADALARTLDALKLDEIALYGTATGAQIAIEFAKRYPTRTALLVLDNACHFEAHERCSILQHYFPDLQPQTDGSHIAKIWQIAGRLFQAFPWFSDAPEHQLAVPMPPLLVKHQITLDYLRAGADYARAYKLAFANEDADQLSDLITPTLILSWPNAIVYRYTQALLSRALPGNVMPAPIAASAVRMASIAEYITQHASFQSLPIGKPDLAQFTIESAKHEFNVELIRPDGSHLTQVWHELTSLPQANLHTATEGLLLRFAHQTRQAA